MPDLTGRTAVVTGTTLGGLGFHTALELARRGARVVLAGRSLDKLDASAEAILEEVPGRRPRTRWSSTWPTSPPCAGRPRRPAARSDRPARQQRRHHGAAAAAHPRRPRVADGDQPLRAVPVHRPAASRSSPRRRCPGGDRVLPDAPRRPLGPARRPTGVTALQPVARLRRRPSWPTCCSPSSSSGAAARPGSTCGPSRRTPASPGTHLAVNGQFGRLGAGGASILDAAVKAVSQSAADGALPHPDGGDRRPAGRHLLRPRRPRRRRPARPGWSAPSPLARDEVAQRRLWDISEETVGLRWPAMG